MDMRVYSPTDDDDLGDDTKMLSDRIFVSGFSETFNKRKLILKIYCCTGSSVRFPKAIMGQQPLLIGVALIFLMGKLIIVRRSGGNS